MLLLAPILLGCPVHRYPDGSGLEGQLEREVIALKTRVRSLEADLATCGSEDEPDSLYAELFQVFSGSEIQVDQRGPATVITVRTSHLFADPWSLTFREESDGNLDLLATALLLNPDHDVTVLGHTDDAKIPPEFEDRYPDNVALSLAIASLIAEHLAESYDLDKRRFTVAGRGGRAPAASNDLEAGQDENRRLELFLLPRAALPVGPG